MKRTGEAGTDFSICRRLLRRKFDRSYTNSVISGALIELAGMERKKIESVICGLMMKGYNTKWTAYHSKRAKKNRQKKKNSVTSS